MLSEESRLREQVEDLKEQVRYWKGMVIDQTEEAVSTMVGVKFGLTKSETRLLLRLHNARGKMVGNQILLTNHEGGDGIEVTPQLIKVFICKLRRKIGKRHVITHWGAGYSLSEEMIARVDSTVGELQCVSSSPEAVRLTAKAA